MPRIAGRQISAPRGTLNFFTARAAQQGAGPPEGLGEWPVPSVKTQGSRAPITSLSPSPLIRVHSGNRNHTRCFKQKGLNTE